MSFSLNYTGTRITDALRGALTTSASAYDAASANTLVPITEAEYNAIALISTTYKASLTDAQLATATTGLATANYMIQNSSFTNSSNGNILTSGGYVTAFKFRNDITAVPAGVAVGYGLTATGTGVSLGTSVATSAVTTTGGYAYYVNKAPNILAPANSLPRFFVPNGIQSARYLWFTASGGTYNIFGNPTTGVTQAPNGSGSYLAAFQFLVTTTKQW